MAAKGRRWRWSSQRTRCTERGAPNQAYRDKHCAVHFVILFEWSYSEDEGESCQTLTSQVLLLPWKPRRSVAGNAPIRAFHIQYIDLSHRRQQTSANFIHTFTDEKALFEVAGTAYGATISEADFDALLAVAKPSYVGKGAATVLDTTVRSSMEIKSFKLSDVFQKYISEITAEAAHKLGQPTELEAVPHKIVLYRAGDFFAEHIDNVHGTDMVASLSVEVPYAPALEKIDEKDWERDCQYPCQSGLSIEGSRARRWHSLHRDELFATAFWHDAKHSVEPCTCRRKEINLRLSIVFDLVQVGAPRASKETLVAFADECARKGIHRLGWIADHSYIDHEAPNDPKKLKGIDRQVAEQLLVVGFKLAYAIPVANVRAGLVHREFVDVLSFSEGHGALYRDAEDEEEEEEQEEENEEDGEQENKAKVSGQWRPDDVRREANE